MATAETAKLVASLSLVDNMSSGIKSATASLGKLSKGIAASRAVAVGLGVGLERVAEKGISALGNAIGDGIQGALTLEKTMNATQAVISSTGGAAGVTAQQVHDMANALEDLTGADDKTIQQGENLLLTFTNIGSKTFPDATKAMVNLAIAMNKGDAATADFDGAAIQLGKALNDPATGFTALKRAGVSFDDAQIKILKNTNSLTKEETKHYNALRKSDKTAAERYKSGVLSAKQLKSQQLILAELNKEFGKAGAAANQGFAGDINRANDAIDDAKIALAQGLIPAVGEVARELSTVLKDPAVLAGIRNFGVGIGDAIKGLVAFAKTVPWSSIADAFKTAAGFAKDLLGAFLGMPTWVQTAVLTGWGLNKLTGGAVGSVIGNLGRDLLQKLGLMRITAGVVQVSGPVAGGPGGVAGAPGKGGGLSILGVGAAAAIGLAIAAAWKSTFQDPKLQEQTDAIGKSVKEQAEGNRSLAELQQSQAALQKGIQDLTIVDKNGNPVPVLDDIFGLLYGGQKQELQNQLTIINAAIEAARKKIPPGPGISGPRDPSGRHGSEAGMEWRRGLTGDRLAGAETSAIAAGVKQGIGPDIEGLRGALGPLATSGDIEALRATTAAGLAALKPTGGGDRGPGSQGDMESRRGAIGDALSSAISSAGLASAGDVESVRGALASGLAPVAQTSDITTLQSRLSGDVEATTRAAAQAGYDASSASRYAGNTAANAAYGAGRGIENAVRSIPAPVTYVTVNVTGSSVTSTTTKSERNGPTGGSSSDDLRDYPH
jgi:hypothetical protein